MATWVIIVAAGSGTRFGGEKQFAPLGEQRVIDHAIATALDVVPDVVVVVPSGAAVGTSPSFDARVRAVVEGGPTRSDSVRAGLDAVPNDAEIVVVHDAARPIATAGLYQRVIAAVQAGADAAIPGVAVADTIKVVERPPRDDERVAVHSTLDRAQLIAVQTPQAFRAAALRFAHASAGQATDDAGLVEEAGGVVVAVEGEVTNFKITSLHDHRLMQELVDR